uniref:C-type lectin domain-containing protein n=1 Tax=Chelydra serpentina TaxID=8475 RepID=A0A8C3SZG0_CHESE
MSPLCSSHTKEESQNLPHFWGSPLLLIWALGYSNWASNEPNNSEGIEDCVEVHSSGNWNDRSCAEKRLIICEY